MEKTHQRLSLHGVLHTHVANERIDGRAKGQALRQGMRQGWPDLMIFHQGKIFFIEMKRQKRADWKISQEQIQCLREIRAQGHCAEVAFGYEHAMHMTSRWMQDIASG